MEQQSTHQFLFTRCIRSTPIFNWVAVSSPQYSVLAVGSAGWILFEIWICWNISPITVDCLPAALLQEISACCPQSLRQWQPEQATKPRGEQEQVCPREHRIFWTFPTSSLYQQTILTHYQWYIHLFVLLQFLTTVSASRNHWWNSRSSGDRLIMAARTLMTVGWIAECSIVNIIVNSSIYKHFYHRIDSTDSFLKIPEWPEFISSVITTIDIYS